MNKVIAILALLAFTTSANAQLLKNFKYDGKIEINGLSTKNQSDGNSDAKDTTSDVNTRVQINASFDLNEDVNAVVSAIRCQDQYGDSATGESAISTALDSFSFEQTYLNVKGVLGLDHKIGRQYYGTEGDLVAYFGPRSMPYTYALAGFGPAVNKGIEGWTSGYKTGKLELGAVLAKLANDTNTPDSDKNLAGLTAKYDLMDEVKLGGYIYENKDMNGAAISTTLDVVGVKANGKFMGFDYNAEMAMNYGRKAAGVNYSGSALLANVKYDMDLYGKFTFMGEFVRGSGDKTSASKDEDFTAINTDYRPGIIWAGVFGNNGVTDLTSWNVGAMWHTPFADKLTINGKFYSFAPTEEVTGAAGWDAYGTELDLCANWQHSENVGLKAYYAMLMPDKDFAVNSLGWTKDDSVSTLGAAMTIKF